MIYQLLKRILRILVPETSLRKLERPLRKVFSIAYRGRRYVCPICGGKFRRFISQKQRHSRLCPACGSGDRKRLLWLYLTRETDLLHKPMRILHFSPGAALMNRISRLAHLTYIPSDYEASHTGYQYDITSIPEADDRFDLLICYHVLEHIGDDRRAMAELYRVLKPGGLALLQVPWGEETCENPDITSPAARKALFGQEDHVRIYGMEEFLNRLKEVGFAVEALSYARELPAEEIEAFVLYRDEIIVVAEKKPEAAG